MNAATGNHVLRFGLYFALVLLAACASQHPTVPAGTACETSHFLVVDGFTGARRGSCKVLDDRRVRLTILPEDDRVSNPSPWYAFKLVPAVSGSGNAEIVLDYRTWPHRYWPKTSTDGLHWQALAPSQVSVTSDEHQATLSIPLGNETLWVAAQELITPEMYAHWNQRAAEEHDATLVELGESRAGQPIHMLDSGGDSRDVVLLVGRQHPPEVSGAFAFLSFWDTVFADTELARQFRSRFRVVSVPLLNPDGVAGGNWRHNLGDTDLNRDWGPFLQPETQLIRDLLDEFDASGLQVRAFLDFHSTERNLFYTQADASDPTTPLRFSSTWLSNARARLQNYDFTDEARPTSDTANGKNYMYKRYGIPSVTYEVGDETDREAIHDAAVIFAEEFMKLLLQHADEM